MRWAEPIGYVSVDVVVLRTPAAVVLSTRLARKLEFELLQLVGLSVELVLAGTVPDMSATVVSMSVMLSITSAVAVEAAVVGARSVGVDTAAAAGLAAGVDSTD